METVLTDPQSEFFLSKAEYVAAVAGFGSGKTQVAITRILASKLKYPTIDQAYLAPTYGLIKSIFYPRVAETLHDIGLDFKINYTDHEIKLQGLGKIICRTMDNPDMIIGWECGDAVMDEFDLLPVDKATRSMEKVSARCRQIFPDGKKNQKMVTTTPEGFKATYQLFKKDPLEDSHLIQMSTYSNKENLPVGYIESLKSQYPDQLIAAYLDGKFVNLTSGTVYYAYDRQRHRSTYLAAPREMLHIGMDFNVYKMAAIVFVQRKGSFHAVSEFIDLRDTEDVIEAIKERFPDHPVCIYPDSSGKSVSSKGSTLSDHKLLKDAGFRLRAKNKNPLIRERVMSCNSAFEKNLVYVNDEQCSFYAECLEQQIYDNSGKPTKDGILDNPVDAGGYLLHWHFEINKPVFTQTTVAGLY